MLQVLTQQSAKDGRCCKKGVTVGNTDFSVWFIAVYTCALIDRRGPSQWLDCRTSHAHVPGATTAQHPLTVTCVDESTPAGPLCVTNTPPGANFCFTTVS